MGSMLSAKFAVFLEFQPLCGGLLVFSPRIILPITIGTRQMNNYSHNSQSNFVSDAVIPSRKTFKILIKINTQATLQGNLEPTIGIEPMTSSLPRKCSTTELRGRVVSITKPNQRWSGKPDSNRRPSAWKADALAN